MPRFQHSTAAAILLWLLTLPLSSKGFLVTRRSAPLRGSWALPRGAAGHDTDSDTDSSNANDGDGEDGQKQKQKQKRKGDLASNARGSLLTRRDALLRSGGGGGAGAALVAAAWATSGGSNAADALELPAFFSGQQGSWLGVFSGYGESEVQAVRSSSAAGGGAKSVRPTTYMVKEVSPPQLQPYTPRGERRIISELAGSKAVLVGIHHGGLGGAPPQ